MVTLKTKKAMKQTMRFLSMAALVVMGTLMAACSKKETEASEASTDNIVTVQTTVSFSQSETTKALTDQGVKTFAAGEQIAVVYTNTSEATVKATSVALKADDITSGKSASFHVTLVNPKAGTVRYVYPASMVDDKGAEVAISSQDGTLESLSAGLDYAYGEGAMTVDGSSVTLPSGVELNNQFAIGQFTLKNFSGNANLSDVTGVTVTDGTNTYTITPKSPATVLTWPMYVAMKPVSGEQTITINATVDSKTYSKAVTGKALAASRMYPVTVQMGNLVDLTGKTKADFPTGCFLQDGDIATGTTGDELNVDIPRNVSVTLRDLRTPTTGNPVLLLRCSADGNPSGSSAITLEGENAAFSLQQDRVKDLTLNGNGSLSLRSTFSIVRGSNTIINGGTISGQAIALGQGDGGDNSFTLNGGTINLTGNFTAILNGNTANITINGGRLSIGFCGKTWDEINPGLGYNLTRGDAGPINVTISDRIESISFVASENGYSGKYFIYATSLIFGTTDVKTAWDSKVWEADGYQDFGPIRATYTASTRTLVLTPKPDNVFSVSSTQAVQFSSGNLYYDGTNWGFESTPQYGQYTENGYISLFRWGANGNTNASGVSIYSTTPSAITSETLGYYGADWGQVVGELDGATGWRTLTHEEWEYLISTRTNAVSLRGFATVGGIKGLIILPDSYSGTAINWDLSDWGNNTYDSISALKTATCNSVVFLPAAGYRYEDTVSQGELGNYWSSSVYSDFNYSLQQNVNGAYCTFFSKSNKLNTGLMETRTFGYSVRLVR